ncbi:MAG: protein kinase [Polyangiaceae bacterium]
MSTEPGRLTPVAVGDVLAGKYAVERVLGAGGMGVVVAAKHLQLGERVAIKFLLPQAMKKAEVVQRFEREARAAVRIKSEHVARVFDVGKLDDGAPYMVMELLEGSDLSSILKTKGAVPLEAAVDYVLQACEAIAEAHSLGIVHRDLKPANLFVTKRADGSPVVKVIDFGISKVVEPEGEVEMTKTDVMMGSPVYMAPEQMISARDVDVRADVWSLGVILFYLVMGTQPFRGNTVTQLYASIIEGPPDMRTERPDVPEALESAVIRCLHAAPRDRWNNVAEFALAIADFGPPTARISSERVARTLGVVPTHRSTPPPTGVTPGSITPPAVASTGLRESAAGSTTGGSPRAGLALAPTEATTGSQHTDGSWAGTQGPVRPARSRGPLMIGGAIVVAGLAGALVVLLLRDGASPPTTAPDASLAASIGSPVPGSTEPPTGGATVVPAPATAGERPPHPPPPPPPPPAPPPPRRSQSPPAPPPRPPPRDDHAPCRHGDPKPKTDLFSDPH